MLPPMVTPFEELLSHVWLPARRNFVVLVFTAPAPEATSMPTPETPERVMLFVEVPKVSAPLLEPIYNFPNAVVGAVALGAVEYVLLLKLPVNVELTVEVGFQFVVTDKLLEVVPVQLPDVCARAGGTRTALAASASKTAMRTRRREENAGLEFIWGGMNGRQIRKRKRASTPEKLGIPRRTKIPSSRAEQVAKRRNRRIFDGGRRKH
jgi:hypothetical protein